jgi:hypothetical protein
MDRHSSPSSQPVTFARDVPIETPSVLVANIIIRYYSPSERDRSITNKTVLLKTLFCGGVAGSIAKTCIAPLERVKILFQVATIHYPYTGVWSTLYRILQREGVRGLYRGNVSSIARVFPYAAIQFAAFDFFKLVFTPTGASVSVMGNFFAGAFAGATAVAFTYPLDVTRARLAVQVEKYHYTGLIDAVRSMWSQEGGLRALYRGLQPTMIGILPYAGINFLTYDTLKWYYTNYYAKWGSGSSSSSSNSSSVHEKGRQPTTPIPTVFRLAFGGIAGALGQTVTYPLDVVRRRMQIDGLRVEKTYSYRYNSTWHGLKTIIQEEGWRTLFRGLHINYIKVVPLVSVSFTINDLLKRWMGLRTEGGVERR